MCSMKTKEALVIEIPTANPEMMRQQLITAANTAIRICLAQAPQEADELPKLVGLMYLLEEMQEVDYKDL